MLKPIALTVEGASANLRPVNNRHLILTDVYSKILGQGHARALMKRVEEMADENNWIIFLKVQQNRHPDPGALDNKQLVTFYSKFGFRKSSVVKGRVWMTRYPRAINRPYNENPYRKDPR